MSAISHDVFASLLVRASRSVDCLSTTSRATACTVLRPSLKLRSQLHNPTKRYASNDTKAKAEKLKPPPQPIYSRHSQIQLPTGSKLETFVPKPLNHPVGLPYPPETSHNTGLDERGLRQRHKDFTNYDRHLERRKQLKSEFSRPYFRDWTMMRHAKGKSFVANERLFKGEKAGYFPNIWGETLRKDKGEGWLPKLGFNTTQALQGKVNIVTVFSGLWAENQVKSFVDKNKDLLQLVDKNPHGLLQLTRINVEEDFLRRMMVKLFKYRLRAQMKKEDWGNYFLVNKSFKANETREAIGFLNGKVGYTYLLDSHLRIRWAGSGYADPAELESMNAGVKRLLEEAKKENDRESTTLLGVDSPEGGKIAIAS